MSSTARLASSRLAHARVGNRHDTSSRSASTSASSSRSRLPSGPQAQSVGGCVRHNRRRARARFARARASPDDASPASDVLLEAPTCELVSNEGGKFSLVGEMVLACDADSMYAMLTDYLASPRIFSTVDSASVDAMDDGRLLVKQSCRWRFLVFGGAFPCQLAVSEAPERRYMEVELHKKGFIREFEGSWQVSEEPTGGVRVRHALALRPALTPPYAHKIFLKQIREILQDVENEAAAWNGGGYAAAADRALAETAA